MPQGAYSVVEPAVAGYTTTYDGCSGTISNGQTAICTITNDDKAPQPDARQDRINDNGGTRTESEWTLTANGPHPSPGRGRPATPTWSAGRPSTQEPTPVGDRPDRLHGDDLGAASRTAASVTGNSITLALGDTATCTITNDDKAPSLTLNKIVVNNNGGMRAECEWTLTAMGPHSPGSGAGKSGNADVVSGTSFTAGTYDRSATGPNDYTAATWSCVKNGGAPVTGSSITLALGDSAICGIKNDDKAAHFVVIKQVTDNGGTAVASDFTLDAGGVNDTPDNFPGAESPGTTVTVDAGAYHVTESGPAGYTRATRPTAPATSAWARPRPAP